MSLVKWKNQPLPVLNNWMDSLFNVGEEFIRPFSQSTSIPAVNVSETEEAFQLELAAPGKKKEDFNVEIENGALCISSEESETNESENKNYTRKEYTYNSFKRSFSLPENINTDSIDAKYSDGILRVTVPKKEPSLPQTKSIKVA